MSIRSSTTCFEYHYCKTILEKILYLLFAESKAIAEVAKILKIDRKTVKRKLSNYCRGFEDGDCLRLRYLNSNDEASLADFINTKFDQNDSMTVGEIIDAVSVLHPNIHCLLTTTFFRRTIYA